jgi:hypothetical protein
VIGESAVITLYSNYKAQSNTEFLMRIRQTQKGVNTLDIQVSEVQVNAPVSTAATDPR